MIAEGKIEQSIDTLSQFLKKIIGIHLYLFLKF